LLRFKDIEFVDEFGMRITDLVN
jgi:hypothetical protein